MEHCPYCMAEIESGAEACPYCGRHLAVEVVVPDKLDPAGERFRERWSSAGRITFHQIGCGCCSVRFMLLACLVLGFRWRPLWYIAVFLVLIELSALFNRK